VKGDKPDYGERKKINKLEMEATDPEQGRLWIRSRDLPQHPVGDRGERHPQRRGPKAGEIPV